MRNHACLGIAITILAWSSALGAAETDPYATIDMAADLALLDHLAHEIGHAAASDPRLATAEMALVDLALCGDPRDRGGRGGIWRRRARELRDLRLAAGAHATTFADAIADLWVDALDGRTAACLDALARYPDAAQHPQARALRCYTTADWGPLAICADLGAHERFALACAYARCGMVQRLQHVDLHDIPAFAYGTLLVWTSDFSPLGSETCLGSSEDQAAQLIGILDTPQARQREAELAIAVTAPGRSVDQVRVALAGGRHTDEGESLLACWNLAVELAAAPGGLRADDGSWLFAGAHERGAAAKLALMLSSWHRQQFLRFQLGDPDSANRLSAPLAVDGGLLGGLSRFIANEMKNAADGNALLDAIDQEIARGDDAIPPMRLIGYANFVQAKRPQLSMRATALEVRIAALQATAEPERAAGWEEVASCLSKCANLAVARSGIVAAATADPYAAEIAVHAATFRGGSIPLWIGEPQARWIDADINWTKVQFPQAGRNDHIGVRWLGRIVIAQAGKYCFATECRDGGISLQIGGTLVVDSIGHPLAAVTGGQGFVDLVAGPHELDLRWYNTKGDGRCRLNWVLPGAQAYATVPPTVLQTPDGQPGLAAALWLLGVTPGEEPDGGAYDRMPWRLDLAVRRFSLMYEQKRWQDALHIGEGIMQVDPGNRIGRSYGWVLKELGLMDDAIAAWKSYLAASDEFDTIHVRVDIANALEAKKDFDGAEQYFTEAAGSWQRGAMLRYAEFLGRRGRTHEGLVWVDRSIERYGEKEDNLVAALVLLSGAKLLHADSDEAMRRIAGNRGLLMTYRDSWLLGELVEKWGMQDRFLAQIDQNWKEANNGLRVKAGIMLMVTGHPAAAIDYLERDRKTQFVTRDDAKGLVSALQTLAARLAKRPDRAVAPEVLRAFIGHEHFIPSIDPLLRYLAGDRIREVALTEAGKDADELLYYLGIDAAARGDIGQARSDLGQVITGHPQWPLAGDARRVLQWIDSGMAITPDIVPAGETK